MRQVKVFSSRGGNKVISITEDVKTYGDLKNLSELNNYDFSELTARDNITKRALVANTDLIPTVSFSLLLSPGKTSNGHLGLNYSRLAQINFEDLSLFELHDAVLNYEEIESLQDYLNSYYENNNSWRTLSSSRLREALYSFVETAVKSDDSPLIQKVNQAIEALNSVKESLMTTTGKESQEVDMNEFYGSTEEDYDEDDFNG